MWVPWMPISLRHHWMKLETLSRAWKVPGWAAPLQETPARGMGILSALAGASARKARAASVMVLACRHSTRPVSSPCRKLAVLMSSP